MRNGNPREYFWSCNVIFEIVLPFHRHHQPPWPRPPQQAPSRPPIPPPTTQRPRPIRSPRSSRYGLYTRFPQRTPQGSRPHQPVPGPQTPIIRIIIRIIIRVQPSLQPPSRRRVRVRRRPLPHRPPLPCLPGTFPGPRSQPFTGTSTGSGSDQNSPTQFARLRSA